MVCSNMLRTLLTIICLYFCFSFYGQCDSPHPDYEALIALYNSTDGPNWSNNDGWREGAAGESCDPCNGNDLLTAGAIGMPWQGIGCINNRVTHISLWKNNLVGEIPTEISLFSNLIRLDIQQNKLSGIIPLEISNLKNLKVLCLQLNELRGQIPSELSKLSSLESLALDGNQLSGSIPIGLSELTNLSFIRLDGNELTGNIPFDFFELTNLNVVILSKNSLSGAIPSDFSKLVNLETLYLDRNEFSGSLDFILELESIETIVVFDNLFSGEIPDLSSSNTLKVFSAGSNLLNGRLPSISDSLTSLILNNNLLAGCIPAAYNRICSFGISTGINDSEALDLRNNSNLSWSGEITNFCNGQEQIGALCLKDGQEAIINDACECANENQDCSSVNHPDYEALMALYNAVSEAPGWHNNAGWKEGSENVSCDPCSFNGEPWYGITCENNRVTRVNLFKNNLIGTIPKEIGNLVELTGLFLGSNVLYGNIPKEIGNLSNLKELLIDFNQLNGEIPTEIGSLKNLLALILSQNILTGPIPSSIGELENLQTLSLFQNILSGNIPPEVGQLKSLLNFQCHDNNFSGLIPVEFSTLENLNLLTLQNNNLSGCYADQLTDLCNVQIVDFSNNPKLPWQGNFANFCSVLDQNNAPCDDSNDTTSNDMIQSDCDCTGKNSIQNNNCGLPDEDLLCQPWLIAKIEAESFCGGFCTGSAGYEVSTATINGEDVILIKETCGDQNIFIHTCSGELIGACLFFSETNTSDCISNVRNAHASRTVKWLCEDKPDCGPACNVGESCDDNNPCTTGETLNADCECTGGTFQDRDNDTVCDAEDVCDGFNDRLIGTSCDDQNACTSSTTWQSDCICGGGIFDDSDGDGFCDADDNTNGNCTLSESCDDGDPCTTGATRDSNCECVGGVSSDSDNDTVCDALDQCDGFDDNLIGSPCDDDSDCTSGTTWQSDCACGGGAFDDMDGDSICDADDQCEGFNDLLLVTACDDDNECTIEDIYDPNTCTCIGIEVDSDNDGICDALDICLAGDDRVDVDNDGIPDACDDCNDDMIGEVCDDGLSDTYDDMILYDGANQEICNCQGLPCPENVSLLDTILCDYESLTINGQTLNINNPSFEFGPFPDQLGCDSTFVVNITFEVSGTENCLDLDNVTIDEDVDDMVVTPENSAVFEDITEETHSLLIYNRWGNKVFQVMNPPIGFTWDGTYQRSGNMLPEGTYYFLLFERSEDGEGIKPNAMKSGFITLLR